MDVVVVISDDNYQQYARTLIKTIGVFNSLNVVHVQIKDNLTEQDSFVISNGSKFTCIRIPQLGKTAEGKRVYSAICRFDMAKNLLLSNPEIETLIYIDADSIVRGPLDPLIELFKRENRTVGLRVRENHQHPYLSGILFFAQQSRPLLDELTTEMIRADLTWGQDQSILAKVLSKNQSYSVLNFESTLVGWDLHKTLLIWSAKGPSRREADAFIFESWSMPYLSRLPRNLNKGFRLTIFALSSLLDKARFRQHFQSLRSQILVLIKNFTSLIKKTDGN